MSKTQSASCEQRLELSQVLIRVVSNLPDLSRQDVQSLVGHEKDLRQVLNLIFRVDPREVDLPRLKALLQLVPRFSPEVRKDLEQAGYTIVEMPPSVTLQSLRDLGHSFKAIPFNLWDEEFEVIPTNPRQVAWRPRYALIDLSTSETFKEQRKLVAKFSESAKQKFGKEVRAIFPSAEEAAWLFSDCLPRAEGYHPHPSIATRTVNCRGSNRFVVGGYWGSDQLYVNGIYGDEALFGVGVLGILVPESKF